MGFDFVIGDVSFMSLNAAKLEKIARMALFDVPEAQIAKAVGLEDIADYIESQEYKDVLARISTEYFEQNQQLNDGWNSVEALALTAVIDNLTWSKDPDFALRAAGMANKANRRGDVTQQPINGQAGARAVFHLTQNFIQKLQNFGDENKGVVNGNADLGIENKPAHKDTDYMVPEKVEKLFVVNQPKVNKPEDMLKFFPDNELIPAE